MQTLAEVRYLAGQLKALAHGRGVRLGDLGQLLGYHPNYLTRTLRGHLPLKVEHVFALLAELGTSPWTFFDGVYPLGGRFAQDLKRDIREAQELGLLPPSRLAVAAKGGANEDSSLEPGPAEHTAEARRLLRDLLRRRGISQPKASRALGLGSMALGQALRGASSLSCQHVFGLLALTRTTPERFFKELSGRPQGEVMAELEWAVLLDSLEQLYGPLLEAAARRRQGQWGPGAGDSGATGA